MNTAIKTTPGFLSLATFGSMLYLASAACALIGVAQVIVPIQDPPVEMLEKFRCLISLNIYEVMLLAAALLIVVWKNVTDDALALVILIMCFLVGSAAAIDVIAPDRPFAAMWFGLSGAMLAVAKLAAMEHSLLGRWGMARTLGLGLLLAWNFAMPAVLGFCLRDYHSIENVDATLWLHWHAGSLVLLLASAVLFSGMILTPVSTPDENSSAETPFLRDPRLRWILVTVAIGASFVHEFGLAWAFSLHFDARFMLMGVVALTLLSIEIRRHLGCRVNETDHILAATPFAGLMFVLFAGGCQTGVTNLWPSHPPIAVLLMAIGLTATGWRVGRRGLLPWAVGSALLGGLTLAWPLLVTTGKATDWGTVWNYTAAVLALAMWVRAGLKREMLTACLAVLPTMFVAYRLLPHAGWATMLLSVLLLGLGTAASVRKANRREKIATPISDPT